jgi:hypothetical protein
MGFDICFDEKTFIPGTPIGENIIQAIDSSRKVIFIITKNFLQSDWGSYELEMQGCFSLTLLLQLSLYIQIKKCNGRLKGQDDPSRDIAQYHNIRTFW